MTISQGSTRSESQNLDSRETQFDLTSVPIRKIFTLIFIHDKQHQQLLLGQKQRGALLGQWNGFGGKVERGVETIDESAARELQEEAFITAPLFPIGFVQWVVISSDEPTYRDVMVIYKAHSLNPISAPLSMLSEAPASSKADIQKPQDQRTKQRITEFKPSDEMAPAWWDIDRLPWDSMRTGHRVWYPLMLADRPFRGVYWYDMVRVTATAESAGTSAKAGSQANAQRENFEEVWVEDLKKRCFQFGTRPVVKTTDNEPECFRSMLFFNKI
ncbi:hypothetical protein EDD21DRAFT_352877 [Dissophora ornata]|nr:hypothetical protein EDD21DRAFT_352877 [Dissophora ornata]